MRGLHVSDYVVIRDVRMETRGARISFPPSSASRMSLSYVVAVAAAAVASAAVTDALAVLAASVATMRASRASALAAAAAATTALWRVEEVDIF
jgi:hypothetical protein